MEDEKDKNKENSQENETKENSEENNLNKNSEEIDNNKNTEENENNTTKKSKRKKKHKKKKNKKQSDDITEKNEDKNENNKEENIQEVKESNETENENKNEETKEKEENMDENKNGDENNNNTNDNIVQSAKKRKKRKNKKNKKKKKEGKINDNDNDNNNTTEENTETKNVNNNEVKEENQENINNKENKDKINEKNKDEEIKKEEKEDKNEEKEEKQIKENKEEKEKEDNKEKGDKPHISKVIEKDSKMLLHLNPISKFLISYLKKHSIDEYLGDHTKYGLVGLENMGNTCYMNSALQCLSNCEYLTKYFLCGYYKKEINKESKYSCNGEIAQSYAELLNQLWRTTKSDIKPFPFFRTFATHVRSFANFSQHDSHEFLIYLLEKLHEDLNRNQEKKYVELNEKQENESDIEASNRWWETHLKRDNSIIMDLFSGQYKSTLKCPFCERISITYDQFSCLELPLENNYFFGTSYVINEKENKIRKINLIFGENETFKEICDKINCQKLYKAILCRNSKMYLASLKDDHNLYQLISSSHKLKGELNDRIIFYEYEKDELDDKLLFFVIPVVNKFSESKEDYYPLFFPKIFYYTKNQTIQNFYDDLKKYYFKYYKEKDSNFSDDKIKLRIVNNLTACTKTHDPCDYCNSDKCISCEFKFGKNMTMGELKGTQSKARSFVMYLDIPKENFENDDFTSIKLYDNYLNDEEDFILNDELTLEKCFNSFSKCEKLDETNEWYCSKCKKHRRGYKQLEIFRLPRYLILQLKRFKNQFGFFSNSKNSALVNFPLEGLNLNKYLVGPRNIDYIYDLISVSQHHGLSFGGHYTAVCKKQNIWYKYDDEDVERTDKENIVNSRAYILIYKLRE